MIQHTPSRPLLLLALLCSVSHWVPTSVGQLPAVVWPFTGQGLCPESLGLGKVVVTADVHLDRILEINQDAQSWRAVHRMHLSWVDPRAAESILTATAAWYNGSGSCSLPCDASMSQESGCCSSLWLPQIDLPNLLEYNYQVTPPRWRIWVEPVVLSNGSSSSKVHWTVRLDGTWFSPFDFRAWPLEHQHLILEMQPSPVLANKVQLVLGSLDRLSNTPHTKGVDIAGWWINKVTPRMFNTSACFKRSNSTYWVYGAADATNGSSMVQQRSFGLETMTTLLSNATIVTTVEESACGAIGSNAEVLSQYGPYVLVIDSMVVRDKTFYILVFIVPLIIVTLMVFVIYAMERQNLEARMGVVVTLVLALSALQFMYNFPPASYLNVVQQLTLTSYVLFGLISIECIITSGIARIHQRKRSYEATLVAAGLKPLGSTSTTSNRFGSGALDYLSDSGTDDNSMHCSNIAPPSSGLFFGSTARARASDPSPLRSAMPPAVTAPHQVLQGPLSPILEVDSRRSKDIGSRRQLPSPAQEHFELEVLGPEEPYSMTANKYPVGRGQAVCEGMEWTWPPFKRKSMADGADSSMSDPEQAVTLPLPPLLTRPEPGKMTQIRQSIGRGRKSMERMLSNVHGKTRALRSKMSMDEAYAQLLARRVDIVCSWTLLVSYLVVIITLLAVSNSVGDHKLMLAGTSAPGNM